MQEISCDVSYVPIDYEDLQEELSAKEVNSKNGRRYCREQRAALETDVCRLQKMLTQEVNLRIALNRGLSRPLGSLPRVSSSLPVEITELLLEVAVLEEEVVSLEKRVVQLQREIDEEAPSTEDENVRQVLTQSSPPIKVAEILLSPPLSPSVSPDYISKKPLISPRKTIERNSNLSKASHPAVTSTGKRINSIKGVNHSKTSVEAKNNPIKSLIPRRNLAHQSSDHPSRVAPQKSKEQRNFPGKTSSGNSTDHRSSKIVVVTKKPCEAYLAAGHTVPFIPMKLSIPKDNEECSPSVSSGPESPIDFKKDLNKPLRGKTSNEKPRTTVPARSGLNNTLVAEPPHSARNQKVAKTPKPSAKERGDVNRVVTSRLPRQPQLHATFPPRKSNGLAAMAQGERRQKNPVERNAKSSIAERKLSSKTDHQKSVSPRAVCLDESDTSKDASVDELSGEDCTSISNKPPNHVKANEQINATREDKEVDLEQVTDPVMLSKELVKLLGTIYGNTQHEQPPLTSDSGASSQASVSTSFSSISPEHYETKCGSNLKFVPGCYGGSFRLDNGESLKYLRECYSSEVADGGDPYGAENDTLVQSIEGSFTPSLSLPRFQSRSGEP